MSKSVWPRPFPGGVADAAGRYALCRVRDGRLAALRLADGHVLWRSEAPLQPLLLGAGLALALAVAPPRVVALAIEGESAGRPIWTSPPLPWPPWAGDAADPKSVQCDLEAAWLDGDVALHWKVRRLYTGGAPLGRSRPAGDVASGSCRLDAASGAVQLLVDWPERGAQGDGPQAVDDPAVLAQHRLGARLYRLVARPAGGAMQTSLVALDEATQAVRWEVILDEGPRRPAPKPRP